MKFSNLIPCTFLILLTSVIITSCQKSNDAAPATVAATPSAQTPASISGGGKTANGISGSDKTVDGISGGGKTANGIGGTGK